MGRRAFAVALFGTSLVIHGCSNGGYASSCPGEILPDCSRAPGAMHCSPSDLACGLDSLPTGLACSAPAQCSIAIDPCPDWQDHPGERVDGYTCSCIGGHWSCDDCSMGGGVCAVAPDGALPFPPVDGA